MVEYFRKLFLDYGMPEQTAGYLSVATVVVAIAALGILAFLVAKLMLNKIVYALIIRSKPKWGDAIIQNKVLARVIHIIPACVIHAFAPVLPDYRVWIQRIAFGYIVLVIVLALSKLLDTINVIYNRYEVSKARPIKGYLQVVKIIASIIGVIVVISVLVDRSPLLLLSGIGAATAVLMLVFQSSIQGLVAGIQLSANDMVRMGDWIEMPKFGADGDVVEISLHTVKVQNWDKTITTIPTYALITESFKNWRGMQEAGGRRIKRSVHIDMTSIRFCTEEMLERYRKIEYIKEYLDHKEKEIRIHNTEHKISPTSSVNGRHLTNIGTFRAYIERYLKNNPNIHQGMIKLVRQLDPGADGLPIEIYVFTSDTAWGNYEAIQADIFDHVLAVLPEFDLRVFQNPTGHDLKSLHDAARG